MAVGSAAQLSTYDSTKVMLQQSWGGAVFGRDSAMTHFTAAMICGVAVTVAMNPFDVIATRLYNQTTRLDARGRVRGSLYSGPLDCAVKVGRVEGFRGFYKGAVAHYCRLGPHTVRAFTAIDVPPASQLLTSCRVVACVLLTCTDLELCDLGTVEASCR